MTSLINKAADWPIYTKHQHQCCNNSDNRDTWKLFENLNLEHCHKVDAVLTLTFGVNWPLI